MSTKTTKKTTKTSEKARATPTKKRAPVGPVNPAKSLVTPNPAFEKMAAEDMARDEALLARIHAALPALDELDRHLSVLCGYEDGIYRFYHHSFKVYSLQRYTTDATAALKKIAQRGKKLNPWFLEIVADGTGRKWERSHNREWLKNTRPIVEAFLHARYFLAMVLKFGKKLKKPPQTMPSGWAAVLELYQQR